MGTVHAGGCEGFYDGSNNEALHNAAQFLLLVFGL